MAEKKTLAFGSANCSLEIEQAILYYLVNDTTHTQASTRFGTHFLAFPLLHVNRHLRQQVAKLLYKIAFQTKRKSLYHREYPRNAQEDSLVLAPSHVVWQDGPQERDDPRMVLNSKNDSYEMENFKATALDHTSPELMVHFKTDPEEQAQSLPHPWSVTVDAKGRLHDEIFTTVQAISTAWFDETDRPAAANRQSLGSGMKWEDRYKAEQDAFKARAKNRYGLKSAVPVPMTKEGFSYDIGIPPLLRPDWGTSGNPRPRRHNLLPLGEKYLSWKFRYVTSYLDLAYIIGDPEMFPASRNIHRERMGIFEETSTLEIEMIQVPLLDLLRPPIAAKSPYYSEDYYDND